MMCIIVARFLFRFCRVFFQNFAEIELRKSECEVYSIARVNFAEIELRKSECDVCSIARVSFFILIYPPVHG